MSETPVGKTQASLDQEDALTSRLLQLAVSSPEPTSSKKAKRSRFGTRNSSFWFKIETIEDEVEKRKDQFKPKELEHIDAEVEGRLKTYAGEFPPVLRGNIDKIREFWLNEMAPLTVASSAGASQAKEVVERLLKTTIDPAVFSRFESMINRASIIKLGLFALEYFHLPPEHLSAIFGGNISGAQPDTELKQVLSMLAEMQVEMKKQKTTPQGSTNAPRRSRPSRS